MKLKPVVIIVDDNPEFAESLAVLLESAGIATRCYSSADEFLHQFNANQPGCLILDVRMPRMSGLALQARLSQLAYPPPIIIMTGHAEVPTALRAMRQGAVDFLQKTFTEDELFDAIHRALDADAAGRAAFERQAELESRFALLSAAERDVLHQVLRGAPNKAIATALRISRRTVEDRRAYVMQKLGVESVADLVRVALEAGFGAEVTQPQ